jgi:hypothetical protein
MAISTPTTELEAFKYARVALGEPVIKVSVPDEQMELRFHEALELFEQYHISGVEERHLVVQLSAQDVSNGYITAPADIIGVSGALAFDRSANSDLVWWNPGLGISNGTFMTDSGRAAGFGSVDVGVGQYGITNAVSLFLNQQQRAYYENILRPEDVVTWNELTRKIKFEVSPEKLVEGRFVVIEAFSSVWRQTPNGVADALKCDWLKRYFVSLVKLQWGQNLTKFTGGTLFGGAVAVNGERILSDAQNEIDKLTTELNERWTRPARFFVG